MSERPAPMTERQEIEELIAARRAGHRARDAAAIIAQFAPDAVICDLAPPLTRRGPDMGLTAAWLATWDGPIELTDHDTRITVDCKLAFVTALTRMQGDIDGRPQDIWFRSTICLNKAAGDWRIVHEHTSVPFYMDGSLRAAIDLRP
jgi:ketosteroid isomerase-like protein